MLTKSNATAYCVLSWIYRICNEDRLTKFYIEPYLNGREDGFAIVNYAANKKVAFSEGRNHDSVVIYSGDTCGFAFGGNVPTEEVYKKAKTVYCREEAARWVIKLLFE